MECALYVPSCNGCLNAIRCWIGRSGRVADIAGSGFNLNVYKPIAYERAPAILKNG